MPTKSFANVLTREYLEAEYSEKNRTQLAIAEEVGCSKNTVLSYIRKHNLKPKNLKPAQLLSKDVLDELYNHQGLSTTEITERLGLRSNTSVLRAMKEYGFEYRPAGWQSGKRLKAKEGQRTGYMDISGSYWCHIRNTAAIRNIEFVITIEDIWDIWLSQNGKCAVSGVDLHLVKVRQMQLKGVEEQTASLDRKDSRLGYTKENVQWVHKTVNYLKKDRPTEELLDWCRLIIEHQESLRLS